MTSKIPLPGTIYRGDGLSGFSRIQISDYTTPDVVYFFPLSEGWTLFVLTYSLPLDVFHRVYQPCASQVEENSSSKTASPSPQPFYSRLFRFCRENLTKIAGR
jgi:hypothetical protein